jgi:hypothetical protein
LVGIEVIRTEESSISKCSLPEGKPLTHQAEYTGKRVQRGVFVTATWRRITAEAHTAV